MEFANVIFGTEWLLEHGVHFVPGCIQLLQTLKDLTTEPHEVSKRHDNTLKNRFEHVFPC